MRALLLADLLATIDLAVPAAFNRPVHGLALDHRDITPGMAFLACQGSRQHGNRFIAQALASGAAVVLDEQPQAEFSLLDNGVPRIGVPHLNARAGLLAAAFFQHPSQALRVTGVTGTNGKTTVAHVLAQAWQQRAAVVGTLGNGEPGHLVPTGHTTPSPVHLQQWFAEFAAQGIQRVAMEVSSHALDQARVAGTAFENAVFTNLSHDHLDYHHTMAAYGAAKAKLFQWPGLQRAILNFDDPYTATLRSQLVDGAQAFTYSLQSHQADCYAQAIRYHAQGMELHINGVWGEAVLHSRLYGPFNAHNLLAAITVLLAEGPERGRSPEQRPCSGHGRSMAMSDLANRIAAIAPVRGRMAVLATPGWPRFVIDYAHTPDGLEHCLRAVRCHFSGPIWCVFGCGGDRDPYKRPLMGRIAEAWADYTVVTNDNPRSEPPQAIAAAILQGMQQRPAHVILDRYQAILYAFRHAACMDTSAFPATIVVAGKGHEQTQEIGNEVQPFSDYAVIAELLQLPKNDEW